VTFVNLLLRHIVELQEEILKNKLNRKLMKILMKYAHYMWDINKMYKENKLHKIDIKELD
jgi:hypothetical protein